MNVTVFSAIESEDVEELRAYIHFSQQWRQRYFPLRRVVSTLGSDSDAAQLSLAVEQADREFDSIRKAASQALSEKDLDVAAARRELNKLDRVFNQLETYLDQYRVEIAALIPESEALQAEFREELVGRLQAVQMNWLELEQRLGDRIQEGIRSLVEIKGNLELTGAFRGQINAELARAERSEVINFSGFILTVLSVPGCIAGFYFFEPFRSLEWSDGVMLKVAVAGALLWIAKWFSRNYANARMTRRKFDHLHRLLGEGAPTIAKMVEADETAKSDVYRRLVALFLEIGEPSSSAIEEPVAPFDSLSRLAGGRAKDAWEKR